MTWASFLMSVIPALLKLIENYFSWVQSQGLIEQGRLLELAEASSKLNATISAAVAAATAAEAEHEKDSTDGAFDKDFERKDGS